MKRIAGLAAALAVASLVSAAPVLAAPATIGSTGMTYANGGISCISALQGATAPGSPAYVVPFDGTIASWSVQGANQPATARLQVYRPLGPNEWRLVAESAVRQVSATGVTTSAARIAVRQGDIIGRTGLGCVYTSALSADDVRTFGYHPTVGSVATPDGPGASAWRLNLRATVEPDCSKGNRKKPKVCRAARR
ncbi:MAG TPA: hypothetical protein VF517_15055 [Thermoleophilaceae bacterium]